jgi:hypothetical protein
MQNSPTAKRAWNESHSQQTETNWLGLYAGLCAMCASYVCCMCAVHTTASQKGFLKSMMKCAPTRP